MSTIIVLVPTQKSCDWNMFVLHLLGSPPTLRLSGSEQRAKGDLASVVTNEEAGHASPEVEHSLHRCEGKAPRIISHSFTSVGCSLFEPESVGM